MPNIQHWQQEFLVRQGRVIIRNKRSELDAGRPGPQIPEEDVMFPIAADRVLRIGKEAGELNLIILIPKTEKRASGDDVSLTKLLASRVACPDLLDRLVSNYSGKNSVNLKKVRLKAEVFSLESGLPLAMATSAPISDTASKTHGALDIYDVTPLRGCAAGGRKVVMLSEFGLAKNDIEPVLQLYSGAGVRLREEEAALIQPAKPGLLVMKEAIVFITPAQPADLAERIYENKWQLKLVARRKSDGLVSRTKFDFDLVPHDFYSPCLFCSLGPDQAGGQAGPATIAPIREVARPGLRKRNMSDTREESGSPDRGPSPAQQPRPDPAQPKLDPDPVKVEAEGVPYHDLSKSGGLRVLQLVAGPPTSSVPSLLLQSLQSTNYTGAASCSAMPPR